MADIPDDLLRDLAGRLSVATEFTDWQDRTHPVSAQTLRGVLTAMGIDTSSGEAVAASLAERTDREWSRMLPTCQVVREGEVRVVPVHVDHGERVAVWVVGEDGGFLGDLRQVPDHTPPRTVGDRLVGRASFEVPGTLPVGYHRIHAWSAGTEASTLLAVTPRWVGVPERVRGRRSWGVAAQLYSARSAQSWGTGDLADLADLATWSGAVHGAGFVLVNPLHAAQPTPPLEPSPYLPTSRRFANPLYLRPERIPEYAGLPDGQRAAAERARRELDPAAPELDRDAAWLAKRALLEAVFEVPRSAGRELAFRTYRDREGVGLVDWATWCAIAEVHGPRWRTWPAELRRPDEPGAVRFRAERLDRVDFHCWLQWVLDEQLAGAQLAARRAGMSLGVLHDLAVGVNPDGADAWGLQDVFALGVTVGAPPDAYNQNGQDWQQPPWRPDRLAETDYAPFRAMVSTVLRWAGGLRVDHIIGLFRLWWIPEGMDPTAGTYVRYDHDALVGILALEAQRAGALVVGEDLGTVEPWVRRYLADRGLLGTSILWFEYDLDGPRDATGRPGLLPGERWREYCLASVTTHDLPPTAGYLEGEHVRLRERLGLLTRPVEEELAAATAERSAWLDEVRGRGLVTAAAAGATDHVTDPGDGTAEAELESVVVGLHRYLTLTPARLLAVSLTDMVGDRRTQNQPGTLDEYPNWRIPLSGPDGVPVLLDEVFTSERAARLAESVRD
ncbi:4-alpha-glucanotransferase [Nakamurella endophytica]|uniref:4-alpha-glucanotransferase n=1 Tax=Nakamurella endophytica TaxID=1748367 RepID=A0A917WGF6_9ACTN|nr:4-alpha-glucanotransferase [Nakamurella endophytica]GGM01076.1 4-alpha-glucanotransferase [Nakamurella endophytica]